MKIGNLEPGANKQQKFIPSFPKKAALYLPAGQGRPGHLQKVALWKELLAGGYG